ncbi:MAG: hypothetical protein Q9166_003434 [cf. Caloplaca sp. 2 TL-2023]
MKSPWKLYVDAGPPVFFRFYALTRLDIPHKKTRQTLVWSRISEGESKNEEAPRSTFVKTQYPDPYHYPQVPTVSTTLPGADAVTPHAIRTNTSRIPDVDAINENAISQAHEAIKLGHPLAKDPRKFHFIRRATTTRTSLLRYSSVRHSGIQKSKKKQKKDFAVFAERTQDFEKSSFRGTSGSVTPKDYRKPEIDLPKLQDEPPIPRKRPLASPAERKWRAETWKQPLGSKFNVAPNLAESQVKVIAPDKISDASLELARELQQFALEETRAANESQGKSSVKVKPKPPKPRPDEEEIFNQEHSYNAHKDVMDIDGTGEDPDTFVFDVYVRQTVHIPEKSLMGSSTTSLEKFDPDKVGLLVIEDEDQEIWELYGEEDQSSDEGWNSEEEDENAEDYYGNDYPEDELDSDDEYGRNTYRHWQSAFDDEEPGEYIDWSDEEIQGKKTWKFR